MQIIEKSLKEVIPYEKNPRRNDAAVDAVAKSIEQFGFKQPIVIDANGVIVAGHTRHKAARKLGLQTVPCVRADDLTPEQIKAYRIADNSTNSLAEWDVDLLLAEIATLPQFDFNDFGLTDLDEMLRAAGVEPEADEDDFDEDEAVEEAEANPITQTGDIWYIGRHRIICGDSTGADVARVMDGKQADLIVTDPPYNVAYVGKTKDALTIDNDSMNDKQFYNFILSAFQRMAENSRLGAAAYIYHSHTESQNFHAGFKSAGYKLAQCLIWVKNSMVMGRQDYQWKHEPILYGWKEGAAHYFTDDRTQTTVYEDAPDFKKMKKEEMVELLTEIFSDKTPTTVIKENKPSRSEEHPTMKPIKLLAQNIRNSSRINEIVLDPFLGSGSTLIAADQLYRECRGVELSPVYCDVIVNRYIKHKGNSDGVYLERDGRRTEYANIVN